MFSFEALKSTLVSRKSTDRSKKSEESLNVMHAITVQERASRKPMDFDPFSALGEALHAV